MDVKQYLDERIIGQENAKIIMAVALRNHFKRVKYNREHPKEKMEKDNIIFLTDRQRKNAYSKNTCRNSIVCPLQNLTAPQ